MSADKTLMVATKTRDLAAHSYALMVMTRLGPSFVQADLAGSYGFYRLVASPAGGGWASGRMTLDDSGDVVRTAFGRREATQAGTNAGLLGAQGHHGVHALRQAGRSQSSVRRVSGRRPRC